MPTTVLDLPSPVAQAVRLVTLGVHELAGIPAAELCAAAQGVSEPGALLVTRAPASALAPLLQRSGSRPSSSWT